MFNICRLFERLSRAFNNQRIKFKILSLYLTIFILSIGTVSCFTYLSTEKQLKENVYHMTGDTVHQLSRNISDKLSFVTEQLVKIRFDDKLEHLINFNVSKLSRLESAEAVIHFKQIFDGVYAAGDNYQLIHSMIIYLDNGMRFQFEEGKYFFLRQKLPDREVERYCRTGRNYCWRNAHRDTTFFGKPGPEVLTIAAPLRKLGRVKALIIVNLNADYFRKLLEETNLAKMGSVLMVSNDGFLSSGPHASSELERLIATKVRPRSGESAQFEYNLRRVDSFVIYDSIRVNGWKLAAVLRKGDLMRDVNRTQFGIIVLTLIIIIVTAVAAYLIAYGLTKPLNKLAGLMAMVEAGNLDIRFNTRYHDEIGKLTRQFNSMLDKIKALLVTVEQEQAQKRRMELKTLQMQIDPHFLYNTLDSIKFLAEQKSDDTSEMVRALGHFYRYSLSKGDEITTVAEEIEHLKSYLTIQKIRYSTRFDYRIEVEEAALDCQTIKFILQPLVENAIYHGVRKKRRKGLIAIQGYLDGGNLIFTVYDNGAGLTPERLAQVRENLQKSILPKESGIGVFNVHQRVAMHYGEQYGLSIDSVANEFTIVTVKCPWLKNSAG
jgi:two-component system sensor histidine kinase YesM